MQLSRAIVALTHSDWLVRDVHEGGTGPESSTLPVQRESTPGGGYSCKLDG